MALLATLSSFLLAFTLAAATTVSDLNVTAIHQNDTIALAKSLASPSVLGTQAQQQNALAMSQDLSLVLTSLQNANFDDGPLPETPNCTLAVAAFATTLVLDTQMATALTAVACQTTVVPYRASILANLGAILQLSSIYTTAIFGKCGLSLTNAAGWPTIYPLHAQALELAITVYTDATNPCPVTTPTVGNSWGKGKGGGGGGKGGGGGGKSGNRGQ